MPTPKLKKRFRGRPKTYLIKYLYYEGFGFSVGLDDIFWQPITCPNFQTCEISFAKGKVVDEGNIHADEAYELSPWNCYGNSYLAYIPSQIGE